MAAAMAAMIVGAPARAEVTADVRLTFQFDSVAIADSRLPPGTHIASGGSFRRVRLGVAGQLDENLGYVFTTRLETASLHYLQITNAYLQYDGLAPFHLKLGILSPPENFEDGTSSSEVMFLERAQPADLARGLGGGAGRAAATLFRYDESTFVSLSLAGGVGNDTPLRQQSLIGRLAWRPWHDGDSNFAIGADVTWLFSPAETGANFQLQARSEMNEHNIDPRLIDTGLMNSDSVTEFGLEMGGNYHNFYSQTGLFNFLVHRAPPIAGDPAFHGWYLQGSWVLTGETKAWRASKGSFGAPSPAAPLGRGGFGAFELAARYSELNLDHDAGLPATVPAVGGVRGGRQRITTLGLNWYPGDPFRFMLDYQHVAVTRLGGTGSDLGAALDLISLRSQIAL